MAGAWAALLLAQTGMRYAEWANTADRVEQTKQNTLRIVKAVVDYLTTASQAKLRRTISYIVAKRRRQGFGHEEVITSMLLLRRSFEKGCSCLADGEAGFLIDAVTRVRVGEVATYLHAINPQEERTNDYTHCLAEEDDDDIGVERPEDVNLSTADDRQILKHETPHVVEVRAFPTEHIPPLRSTRIPSLFGSSTLTVCSYKLRTLRDTDTFGVNRIRTSARPCTCSLFPTSLRSSSGRDRAGHP